jgi:endoglucanase
MSLDDFPATVEIAGRELPLTLRPDRSDAGTPVKEIDLSLVAGDQPFRIRIPGVGVSYETEISEQSVLRSFYVVTRGLFHNRFARDTRAAFTDWVRPRDDQRPVWTAEEPDYGKKFGEKTPKVGPRKVLGGHHDAGDFDIRPMHYQVAMLLFEAYELRPQAFSDRQLTIPESGNGVPDLLDEALYSLKGWEDLQEKDGGVRLGIEAHRHPWGLVFADQDPMDYWTYARSSKHTLRVAALFAQGARLVRPFDAGRASALLARARRAFDYATRNGATDRDFGRMLFATGELWRATGEARYKEQFERIWRANVKWGKYPDVHPRMLWTGAWDEAAEAIIGEYVLGYLNGAGADPVIVGQARQRFSEYASEALRNVERLAHRHGRNPGSDPSWGEDTGAARWVMPCVWLLRAGGSDTQCIAALALARDYALGANPLSMSWFTGLGERQVRDPLHLDSRAFRLKDRSKPEREGPPAMPGIPVYGPVRDLPRAPHYNYAARLLYPPLERRPLLRRYTDNSFWVTSNEFDVVHHALQALSMAALMTSPLEPPNDWLPAAVRKAR